MGGIDYFGGVGWWRGKGAGGLVKYFQAFRYNQNVSLLAHCTSHDTRSLVQEPGWTGLIFPQQVALRGPRRCFIVLVNGKNADRILQDSVSATSRHSWLATLSPTSPWYVYFRFGWESITKEREGE